MFIPHFQSYLEWNGIDEKYVDLMFILAMVICIAWKDDHQDIKSDVILDGAPITLTN